jgi:hypothetical protein
MAGEPSALTELLPQIIGQLSVIFGFVLGLLS